jgi:uncharacterized protein YndB with AHSA1/START domain
MAIKRTYYIDAPIEAVWKVFTSVEAVDPTMMHVHDVKQTRDGVGTNFSWDFKVGGRTIFSGFEVYTDVVPHERLVERSGGFMSATWVTTFTAEAHGTDVTIEVRPEGLWRFPPLLQLMEVAFARRSTRLMPLMEKKAQELARKPAATPRKKAAPRRTRASAAR